MALGSLQDLTAPFGDPYTWYHIAGYGYAVIVPIWPLRQFAEYSHLVILSDLGVTEIDSLKKHHRRDLPFLVGIIERTLYVASWLAGAPEFIGVWLALKVAGGWKGWSEDTCVPVTPGSTTKVRVTGRLFFNTHLVGSGLSVLNALVGALMVEWLNANLWARAIWVAIAAAIFTVSIGLAYKRARGRAAITVKAA